MALKSMTIDVYVFFMIVQRQNCGVRKAADPSQVMAQSMGNVECVRRVVGKTICFTMYRNVCSQAFHTLLLVWFAKTLTLFYCLKFIYFDCNFVKL